MAERVEISGGARPNANRGEMPATSWSRISDARVSPNDKVSLGGDELLHRPRLAVLIAVCIARWADIEARLEGFLISVVGLKADRELESFRLLKGWDARSKEIEALARNHLSSEEADRLIALLRLVAMPAAKRHELAHGVWGLPESRNDQLVLFPAELHSQLALAAAQSQEGPVSISTHDVLSLGVLIREDDLIALANELGEAVKLVHDYYLTTFSPKMDLTGQGFADVRAKLSINPEIAGRTTNMAKARKRAEKAASRKAAD